MVSFGVLLDCSLQLSGASGGLGATRSSVCNASSISAASRVALRQRSFTNTRLRVNAETHQNSDPDVDITVFRFTLGISGFDDSTLPCIAGVLFGGLLVLNHALSIDFISIPQWRSESVGMILAVLAISLPSLGDRLEATRFFGRSVGGRQQLFLAASLTARQKSKLAWGSYALLQNSNTTAVLVCAAGRPVCSRGWPKTIDGASSDTRFDLLVDGLGPNSPACTPNGPVTEGWVVASNPSVIQPLAFVPNGFLVVVANGPLGYNQKDRAWIRAMATTFSKSLAVSVAECL